MFEQTFVGDGEDDQESILAVFVSFLIQCGLVVVGIIIPMIYYGSLPEDAAYQLPGGASASAASAASSAPLLR